jgi:predicted ABC-type transport system involved in lysophospholipase L1 biosynthesis ATPase subunit
MRIYHLITAPENPWTMLVVTDDPQLIWRCDKVIFLENGMVSKVEVVKKA